MTQTEQVETHSKRTRLVFGRLERMKSLEQRKVLFLLRGKVALPRKVGWEEALGALCHTYGWGAVAVLEELVSVASGEECGDE